MNSRQFVSQFERLVKRGRSLSSEAKIKSARLKPAAGTPNVLIFSPHPDDECIIGALPLRLWREAKWNVVNIGVTLGSKRARQNARGYELQRACAELGFNLLIPGKRGLEHIHLETRKKNPARWKLAVKTMVGILAAHSPRVIFLPHEKDVHPAHIGVHFLVLDALKCQPKNFECHVVETEFWGQMEHPNLLVESSAADVADLVAALARHVGEVRRNAYHARLPAWMVDNVRRGAELVGTHGGAAPDFIFGTIYRLQRWRDGKLQKTFNGETFLPRGKNAAGIFG